MGHRCNLVIIENGKVTVYYDHWAANILHVELLWGSELARKFIEERDAKPNSWLDDSWSEGGCVVDFDSKHLLWYGGEDILYAPELNLISQELLERQWTGWTIEWAKDGIFDLARKAGVAIEAVSSNRQRGAEILGLPYIYESETDKFFYADNVISVIQHGKLSWAILKGNIECLKNNDVTFESIASLVHAFCEEAFEQGKALDPNWGNLIWGAHFDADSRSMEYWNPNPSEGLKLTVAQQFEGWAIVDHGPNYLWHEALVPTKDWPSMNVKKKLDLIQSYRRITSQNRTNPILNFLTSMSNDDQKNIRINTHALERRKGDRNLLQAKTNILNELEAHVKRQG